MKQAWLAVAAMAAGLAGQAQECPAGVQMLTVYVLSGKTMVPIEVVTRARYIAGKVMEGAGVTVEWVKGERPSDGQPFCGDRMTIAFDAKAPLGFTPQTMAYSSLNAGSATEIHIFYDRVSAFPDRSRLADFLGHVMAHEMVHVLQGVVRHSSHGVMKARWDVGDCSEMVRKPLPFAAEDVERIRSHFRARTTLVAAN